MNIRTLEKELKEAGHTWKVCIICESTRTLGKADDLICIDCESQGWSIDSNGVVHKSDA